MSNKSELLDKQLHLSNLNNNHDKVPKEGVTNGNNGKTSFVFRSKAKRISYQDQADPNIVTLVSTENIQNKLRDAFINK